MLSSYTLNMIREAELKDLDRIEEIYSYARGFMKANGNPTQWGDTYPRHSVLLEDIVKRRLYVIENDEIDAVFVCEVSEDETYSFIEGEWKDDGVYSVIHRIASREGFHGALKEAIAFASTLAPAVRVDTHKDNKIMNSALIKAGFAFCGIIYTYDNTPRNAYSKIV